MHIMAGFQCERNDILLLACIFSCKIITIYTKDVNSLQVFSVDYICLLKISHDVGSSHSVSSVKSNLMRICQLSHTVWIIINEYNEGSVSISGKNSLKSLLNT